MPKELHIFYNDTCWDYQQHEPVIDEFIAENPDIVVTKFNFTDMSHPPTSYYYNKYAVRQSPTYIGVQDEMIMGRQDGGKPSKFALRSLVG